MQVQQIYPEIQELGGEVLAINFAKPERIRAFVEQAKFPFPVLADPDMQGYRAFELGHVGVLSLLRPRVIWGFIKMIAQGVLPTKPTRGDDLLQLGGDFIIDSQNRLTFAHPTKDPADNPAMTTLLDALRRVG